MTDNALDLLHAFLRPPGRGIWIDSTGGGREIPILRALYGTMPGESCDAFNDAWRSSLEGIRQAKAVVLGIPSDAGAAIVRGCNFGPIGVRRAFLKRFARYPSGVLDLGDVFCVQHLIDDEMLSAAQIKAIRRAIYPTRNDALPVSPHAIAYEVIKAVYEMNPQVRIVMIGGDHGVTWPVIRALVARHGPEFGVLQIDAHTDTMEHRLGVQHCFSTWAFHTMQLIDPRNLVQVGLRDALRDTEGSRTFGQLQVWISEIRGREAEMIARVVEYFRSRGIDRVYVSNDIDGTDESFAPSAGTREPEGLHPDVVGKLIRALRDNNELIGGDIVEVAPPLSGRDDYQDEPTCLLAAMYLNAIL